MPETAPTLNAHQRRVLSSVRRGCASLRAVAADTGMPPGLVRSVAAALRGDPSSPRLLCCLDGMPWAPTLAGLAALAATTRSPAPAARRPKPFHW